MRRHPSRELPLHADPTRRTIVLGPKAHELRAYVGSTAWAVLEEMMQRSTGDGDHVVAQISIRSLASSLSLAKDTVNRAVRRLRDLGVIAAVQARSRIRRLRGRLVSPRGSCRVHLGRLPVAAFSVASVGCSSVVGPPLVRSALAALRGLRAPPVFVRRFAPLSFFRQVPARDRVGS